jgi:RNA polymerase sigma-70 factor (ECF subfamily)
VNPPSRDAEQSDTELVRAAQQGDTSALDTLLRRHHQRVHRLCRRLAGNDADAADATQEALIAVVRGLPRFDGRAAFTTWLYRVSTNAALDELRRRQRRPVPRDPDLDTERAAATDRTPTLDQQVADRLTIDAALADLPTDFRVAVVLRDVAGLDYAEIAAVLDLPPGTVRSRIARGRGQLARRLGNPSDEPNVGTGAP